MCPCPSSTLLSIPLRAALSAAALAVSLALAAAPAAAQAPSPPPAEGSRPLLRADELKTFFFTPQHGDVHELASVAHELHGRKLWVVERGGYDASPVPNLQVLGETIVIHDVEQVAQRIGEALHGLDQQVGEQKARAAAEPPPSFESFEWRPAHISLQTAVEALAPALRSSVNVVEERRALVLRGPSERLSEIRSTLESLDQPEPQVLLSCLVVAAVEDESFVSVPPPADLVEHLAAMVPFGHFDVLTRGVVRTSATARSVQIRMGNGIALSLRPEAYDPQTGALTARCEFVAPDGFAFETRTSIGAGEHTVLGATGGLPIFVVVNVQRLD